MWELANKDLFCVALGRIQLDDFMGVGVSLARRTCERARGVYLPIQSGCETVRLLLLLISLLFQKKKKHVPTCTNETTHLPHARCQPAAELVHVPRG